MKQRVTIIYDYFTPSYKAGGPTQSLVNLSNELMSHVSLQVICGNKDLDGTPLEVKADECLTQNKLQVYYSSDEKRERINSLIENNDVLFINSIFSHHFNYPSLIKSRAKRKIVSPRGMLDPGSLSQKAWKKKLYLAYWKLAGLHRKCEFHAASEVEKNNIRKVFGEQVKIWQVPNFPRVMDYQQPEKIVGELTLVTIALISPMKNHLLVLKALQKVSSKVTWHIYGPVKDKNYWEQCSVIMGQLPGNVEVNYHGDVIPEQVAKALAEGQVFIQPSKSENFGHSIFEAFTAGKPVITSHTTPWKNLEEQQSGVNIAIDNESVIAAAVEHFAAMDAQVFDAWSKGARAYAFNEVDLEEIRKGYLEMFQG